MAILKRKKRDPSNPPLKSKFEKQVWEYLRGSYAGVEYEPERFVYYLKPKIVVATVKDNAVPPQMVELPNYDYWTKHHYKPDFWIPSHDCFIEAKGLLSRNDVDKMEAMKLWHPNIDVRFLFMRKNKKLSKKLTYEQWCEKVGYLYSIWPNLPLGGD